MTRVVMVNNDNNHSRGGVGGNKTRICIKNCPKSWKVSGDVERFLMSSSCNKKNDWKITDCKLLQRSQMAFVGFRMSDMAEQAVRYFNQTYALTAKLHVSLATNPPTNSTSKGNNHHNNKNKQTNHRNTTATTATNNKTKRHALLEQDDTKDMNKNEDNKKQEFLATNDKSASFWSNDDGLIRNDEKEDSKIRKSENENTTKKDLKAFFKSKVSAQDDLSDADDTDDADDKDESNNTNKATNRLFVRNLPFQATEEELAEFFDGGEVYLPLDDTGKNKGFAFVTFPSTAKAQETLQSMNQMDFQGRLLHLLPANPPPQHQSDNDNNNNHDEDESTNFKQKREQERKSNDNEKSWSTSHVSSDAVITTVASRLQLSKGQVLNVKDTLSSGDAAVRLAMGETHLQEENAVFFQNHQIDVTSNKQRSKTILLVKNLPPISNIQEELTKFFHMSSPEKFSISPSNTVAILHYATSKQAKQAIRKYSYKRFHNIPLYLEYAPMLSIHNTNINNDALTTKNKDKDATTTNNKEHINVMDESKDESKSTSSSNVVTHITDTKAQTVAVLEEEEEDNNSSRTIYVKNLNFQTTEDDLRQFLEKHNKDVLSIRIPTKVGPKSNTSHQQQLQSMGYGFVECISHDAAQKVLTSLKQKPLQGHYLECQYSQTTSSTSTRNSNGISKQQQKVLMVRNIPFQATKKEIMQLFGAYGTLKQVRLPKKFQAHQHRGFAFVEFATPKEAQAAKDALAQTHLYGRHLVIEYATENTNNEGINNVGNKKHKVEHSQIPKNKKIRFD